MTKFYRADNAGAPIEGVQFQIYAIIAGSACGVFSTSDKVLIEKLDKLVDSKRIKAISQEDYELSAKKKVESLKSWRPLLVNTQPQLPRAGAIKGSGAVTVQSKANETDTGETSVEVAKPIETVDDALKTVAPDSPPAPDLDPVVTAQSKKSNRKN